MLTHGWLGRKLPAEFTTEFTRAASEVGSTGEKINVDNNRITILYDSLYVGLYLLY